MMSTQAEKIYRILADRIDQWVDAPLIQRVFTQNYGSPIYKPAMDEVRYSYRVEHRYHQRGRKKFWQYRLSSSQSEPDRTLWEEGAHPLSGEDARSVVCRVGTSG